jgi:hypothetical protein
MIKNQTQLVDNETQLTWKVLQRIKGQDMLTGQFEKPKSLWVLILVNQQGERRFIPEHRVLESYRLVTPA